MAVQETSGQQMMTDQKAMPQLKGKLKAQAMGKLRAQPIGSRKARCKVPWADWEECWKVLGRRCITCAHNLRRQQVSFVNQSVREFAVGGAN